MNNFCDIIPHPAGWTYVMNGIESRCSFHTYELAVAAARVEMAKRKHSRVFRRMELNGEMLPVQPPPGSGLNA